AHRGVAVYVLERVGREIHPVRRRRLSDPEPDPERLLPPPLRIAAAQQLARAHERRGALELLEREHPERVAHEHSYACVATPPAQLSLQTPKGQGVGGETEVRLRLPAASWVPE